MNVSQLNHPTDRLLYVIAGPTAVGKTAIAIQLAQTLQTEIVSADSRQCYYDMTIGTAKPSSEELAAVHHYFIDDFPVEEALTAADYEQLALGYLQKVFRKNKTAVVCGGTGLYIRALCEGLDEMPEINDHVVTEVNRNYEMEGLEWLQNAVAQEDPLFYSIGEIQNPARLIRALIFKRSTGKSILDFRTGNKKERPFKIIKTGLELPRPVLYERINHRVDMMMEQGLLDEVKSLYPKHHLKNLQTVGYAELFDHLDGKCTLIEAVEKIKQNTRHYAKRQMTWFKKDTDMNWFAADDPDVVQKILAIQ
jgi:tRNA dimethylallyltransferase